MGIYSKSEDLWLVENGYKPCHIVISIGRPPKEYKSDLADADRSIVDECKCYTWTDSGNVLSQSWWAWMRLYFTVAFCILGQRSYFVWKSSVPWQAGNTGWVLCSSIWEFSWRCLYNRNIGWWNNQDCQRWIIDPCKGILGLRWWNFVHLWNGQRLRRFNA